MIRNCSVCECEGFKVIYAGFPMWLCHHEFCGNVWGFWSFIIDIVGFNGVFMAYGGSYLLALWEWLTFDDNA